MARETFNFSLGVGTDAEVTITAAHGDVLPEHVVMLGRYLMLYFEAIGGTPAQLGPLLLSEQTRPPLATKKPRGCAVCGQSSKAKVHPTDHEYVSLLQQSASPPSEEENAPTPSPSLPIATTTKIVPAPAPPGIDQAGILRIDVEHEDVSFDIAEGRYTVLYPSDTVDEHQHRYRTGKNVNIEKEALAICECSHTIMVQEAE